MPLIFLSPASEASAEASGRKEESTLVNRIADEMEPLLCSRGILCARRSPKATVGKAIQESNGDYYDLHLALHVFFPGQLRNDPCTVYYSFSRAGRCAAETLAGFYREIYPHADHIKVKASVTEPELIKINAPAVLFCCGTGEEEGLQWAERNIPAIAENLTGSICHLFGVGRQKAVHIRLTGRMNGPGSGAGLYAEPSVHALRLAWIGEEETVLITGVLQGWYEVEYQGKRGFAQAQNILLP